MPPAKHEDRLIETKLHPPLLAPTLLRRPRLEALLTALGSLRLTSVVAPAGYGKTTLLGAWLARQDLAVAWLSLDPADDDPRRFYRYLLAACAALHPGFEARGLLPQSSPFDPTELLTALVNHLAGLERQAVLVLDDLHAIADPTLHTGIAFLLEHLPARLHLAVTSRTAPPLPLSRLRARGQLLELGPEQLRFTAEETAGFLAETMDLQLDPEQLAVLQARTEGWAASLHLAALSLRSGEGDRAALFERGDRYALDYLADEVFARLPADLQTFLLHSSVLERLNPDLCRAVTGNGATALLRRARAANLFLIPLDPSGDWYRYHSLFADFLRSRLRSVQPELLPELHGRAAAWFDAAGYTDEAISHVLAGGDLEQAVALVEEHSRAALWLRDERPSVRRWLAALPAEVVRSRPRLALDHAWIHFGQPSAEQGLADIERQLGERSDGEAQALRGELALLRAEIATTRGDLAGSLLHIAEADALLSEGDIVLRSFAAQARGYILRLRGEMGEAEEALQAAAELCRTSGSLLGELASLNDLAEVYKLQGRWGEAERTFERAIALAEQDRDNTASSACAALTGLADLRYGRNDLAEALRLAEQGLGLAQRAVYSAVEAYACLVLARTLQALDRSAEARERLQQALLLGERLGDTRRRQRIEADCVPLWLRWNDRVRAERWAARQPETPGLPHDHYERDRISLARVQLFGKHPEAALVLLEPLRRRADEAGRAASASEMLVLEARAHWQLERRDQATRLLLQALALAEPERRIRVFVDEGEALLPLLQAALAEGGPAAFLRSLIGAIAGGPGDSGGATLLTERELQVLTLIAEGLSNQAIADRLIRSLGTIKAHSSNIYGKLGARNRTEAVTRARELELI